MFIGLLSVCITGSFGEALTSNSKGPIKWVSIKNEPCHARPTLLTKSSDKALFYPIM